MVSNQYYLNQEMIHSSINYIIQSQNHIQNTRQYQYIKHILLNQDSIQVRNFNIIQKWSCSLSIQIYQNKVNIEKNKDLETNQDYINYIIKLYLNSLNIVLCCCKISNFLHLNQDNIPNYKQCIIYDHFQGPNLMVFMLLVIAYATYHTFL